MAVQHAILMADVMRGYLARRVPRIRASATTRQIAEVLRSAPAVPYDRTLRVLESVDLLKFARQTMGREHAQAIGNESKAIVQAVETQMRQAEATARAAAESSTRARAA